MFKDSYRVMVVDDELAIAEGLATTLGFLTDFHYEYYNDVNLALESFEKDPCHLVLTDVTMPGLNGFEFMSLIKSRQPWTDIIVITAHRSDEVLQTARQAGAADVFFKPVDIEELEMSITACHRNFMIWQSRVHEVSYARNY